MISAFSSVCAMGTGLVSDCSEAKSISPVSHLDTSVGYPHPQQLSLGKKSDVMWASVFRESSPKHVEKAEE